MNQLSRFVALAVMHVETPTSIQGTLPAMSHLAAIGMLIAARDAEGQWRFSLVSHATEAGEGEDALLSWATRMMPPSGIVIGWQLAERIVPPLLEAGANGDPDIDRAFLDRFMTLVTAPSVDLAIPHGGAGAPSLTEIVARHGIELPSLTAGQVEAAWALGNRALLRKQVEAMAVATWRLWLAEANGSAGSAATAFDRWLQP